MKTYLVQVSKEYQKTKAEFAKLKLRAEGGH